MHKARASLPSVGSVVNSTMLLSRPFVVKAAPDVVAVHKPAGMPFHTFETGQPGLLATLRQDKGIQQQLDVERLYAVHRLDTATSGLVLFATSKHIAGLVSKSFRDRRYVCIWLERSW